jgi:hypothetical protein
VLVSLDVTCDEPRTRRLLSGVDPLAELLVARRALDEREGLHTAMAAGDPGLPGSAACHVVAEEVVLRGRDYLGARWDVGGERFKMMSAGRRYSLMSPTETWSLYLRETLVEGAPQWT